MGYPVQLNLCLSARGTLSEAIHWKFANAVDHLRPPTLIDYRDRAAWLVEALSVELRVPADAVPLAAIGMETLMAVAKKWGPTKHGPGKLMLTTVKKRFVLLHQIMTESMGRGIIEKLPVFPKLRNDGRARKRIHTQTEFEAMRAELPEKWQTWVTVAWTTGMRTYDVNRARENWFRIDEPFLATSGDVISPGRWLRHAHKTDGDDENTEWLPMPPGLYQWWLEKRPQRGAPHELVAGRFPSAPHVIAAACERAGVPRISPNDLRRSKASICASSGWDQNMIRILLGHKGNGWTGPGAGGEMMKPQRPSVLTGHYLRPTADTFAGT